MNNDTILLPDPIRMPVRSNSLWPWLWFFLYPYRKTFTAFFSFRVLRYTIMSMMPLIIGYVINAFEDGWAFKDPQKLVLIVGGFLLLNGIANLSILFFITEAKMEDRLVRGMTLFGIRHMNALPLPWHEAQGSGSKLQRVMTARTSMQQLYGIYKWSMVPFASGIFAIILSVVMLKAPPFFFLLFAGFIVSFLIGAYYTAKPMPALHNKHNIVLERLMSGVYEFVSAVRTVKAFHMGDYIGREARHYEWEGHKAKTGVFRATYFKWGVLNSIGFFWTSIFIIVCTMGVYQHWLGIGSFATIFFLASNLWIRLEEMVYMQDQFMEFRNGFMRLTETLKAPIVSYDRDPVRDVPENWKSLSFSNVDFTYESAKPDEAPPTLHNINLTINRGDKIALVGRSGAGKSTLVKLLMKQVIPSSGQISIDDTGLDHIRSAEWLSRIGFVPQDVELFNMSVRDNILLDRGYDDNRSIYQTALKQSALDQLMESLPQKDETIVGERGIKLSGGQRQRLGIARALVRDADIIIFDEATASLDSLSEQIIQNALSTAFSGRTMFIIAHRLSTVRFADRIVVMDEGRIVESGTFNDLVTAKGRFAQLWEMQSSGFIDGEPEREYLSA